MIIPNGTIEFISKTSGGLDANGYPVKAVKSYGSLIPCQYSANTYNNLGKTNGESFIKASYSILIEAVYPMQMTELLRLRDRKGEVVKEEVSVLEVEPLDAVCQIRILV